MFVVEFREDIQISIPAVAEHLKNSDPGVRSAAIELLSRLATQGMCKDHFQVGMLKHVYS